MRKLTLPESNACRFLRKHGAWTPGDVLSAKGGDDVRAILDKLAKKGRVSVEPTDDGPRYSLTALGEADAA